MKKGQEDQFTVIVEPCEEGGFFAMCPAFPGCYVKGETSEEALRKMKSAIDAFIEDYKEEGETYLKT